MKIDFSRIIAGRGGKPFKYTNEDGETVDLTLSEVAYRALNAPAHDKPLNNAEALKRGMLSLKVWEGGPVDITAEEAALVQTLLSQMWSSTICAIAHTMLEGNDEA